MNNTFIRPDDATISQTQITVTAFVNQSQNCTAFVLQSNSSATHRQYHLKDCNKPYY